MTTRITTWMVIINLDIEIAIPEWLYDMDLRYGSARREANGVHSTAGIEVDIDDPGIPCIDESYDTRATTPEHEDNERVSFEPFCSLGSANTTTCCNHAAGHECTWLFFFLLFSFLYFFWGRGGGPCIKILICFDREK